ncbi:helix-turn-helix transcriptional regulator [Nocardiopsis sp. RSe5-2]|uniref:Helix-turn-helix transcriptional regulator n=1 Tax=Nocardiopsis endophytica TaxID=3018445 RepID=A0ABT4U1J5_9ACTN|nr:helix-turn-helix transcriptional regulator [Nocardiopsis endophytica]MDA2810820.1 helix-turn-helix transcriptional regulator [Nocardiopsis endophytica]
MNDYQTARHALGTRLRELRSDAGLSGRSLAGKLGWPPSKVSKLEHGRQTATGDDLRSWAEACGAPGAAGELIAQRRAMETHYASWRRQLAAGTRARQRAFGQDESASARIRVFESACVPGLLQTPEYARHMLRRTVELHRAPDTDVEEGVRARIRRQEVLYEPHRRVEVLMWEPALRMLICPEEVMAGQLDRIAGLVGMRSVDIAVVPAGARLRVVPSHGFWIFDDRMVVVETIGAELRLDDPEAVVPYRTVFEALSAAAVREAAAHRLLARIRGDLLRPAGP